MTKYCQSVLLTLFLFSPLLSSAEKLPELSSYQQVNRLWIGLAEGVIEPSALETVQTQIEGYYLIEARDGDWLEKEQHWLTIEPNKLQLEKQELALEEEKAKEAQRKATSEESEELQRLEEKLEEILEQQRLLAEALSNEQESEILPSRLNERVQVGLDKLEAEAERVRALMRPESRQTTKELAEKEQALQLERKRLSLIAIEKRSRITAPFEGMLNLSTEIKERLLASKESNGLVWLPPGTGIGLIADRRSYIVRIPAEGTQLNTIPQDRVRIMIKSKREGKLVMADLLRVKQELLGAQVSQTFEFEISKEDAKSLSIAGQQKTMAHLFRIFETPCRVVPKRDIAFEHTSVLQDGGWKMLVQKLWPEAELVAVGPQHLAVRKKQ